MAQTDHHLLKLRVKQTLNVNTNVKFDMKSVIVFHNIHKIMI